MKIQKGFQAQKALSSSASTRSPFVELRPSASPAALAVPFQKLPPLAKKLSDLGPLMEVEIDQKKIFKPDILDSAMARFYDNPDSMIMAHILNINSERLMNLLH